MFMSLATFCINAPLASFRYTLSLHDALPISRSSSTRAASTAATSISPSAPRSSATRARSARCCAGRSATRAGSDRKSTRLNSSHSQISYAVFCLKKKKRPQPCRRRRRASHRPDVHVACHFLYQRAARVLPLHSFPTRRSSDLSLKLDACCQYGCDVDLAERAAILGHASEIRALLRRPLGDARWFRSEEHTSELQSQSNLVCRLLLEKKKTTAAMSPSTPRIPPS